MILRALVKELSNITIIIKKELEIIKRPFSKRSLLIYFLIIIAYLIDRLNIV